ncbi:MAG: response regulator transcription factor [Solirubrobacteraceae bacterium]
MGHLRVAPDPTETSTERSASMPIRVALGVDHDLMRSSLRRLLGYEEDIEVIADSGDLPSTTRTVRREKPHVLVLGHRAPDRSRCEAIEGLRARAPDTQIVLLTMEDSPLFARKAHDSGALGFVLTDRADSDLPPAIRAVARGDEYVSPRTATKLVRSPADEDGSAGRSS